MRFDKNSSASFLDALYTSSSHIFNRICTFELVLYFWHRPLKLRTDGGQTRVRELGSIDLFVVTFLKMNELSPNFEHKLLIMCGMLAANFIVILLATNRISIVIVSYFVIDDLIVAFCGCAGVKSITQNTIIISRHNMMRSDQRHE